MRSTPSTPRVPRPAGLPEGVGIGLRKAYADQLPSVSRRLDWVEIIPENFAQRGGLASKRLDRVRDRWQLLAHGVSASVGGPDPFDTTYLRDLKALLDRVEAPFYSDHLCYSTLGGLATHDLLPMPFTDEAMRHTAARIRELSERLERPVAVENISFYAIMPGGGMSEPEFVSAVCEEADCGLLLDVNNIWVNAFNFGRDAMADLAALPLHRAWQIHIAGHEQQGPRLIDTHGSPVIPEVLALLRAALDTTGPLPVLLEWDTSIPALDRVLDEADTVRDVVDAVAREAA